MQGLVPRCKAEETLVSRELVPKTISRDQLVVVHLRESLADDAQHRGVGVLHPFSMQALPYSRMIHCYD